MVNIVICADGTWNRSEQGITQDFSTTVLKLARALSGLIINCGILKRVDARTYCVSIEN
ncbi:MAG: hypothetical protein ACI80S_001862 [Pseudohongiellaceae bacterium]|jgi:uncharacterized protein (DUF2235 family)